MATKKPATTATTTDFFGLAAATATGTTTKSKTEKRQVVVNDPAMTEILKTLTINGTIEDEAAAAFSGARGELLQNYAIEAFLKGPNAESFQMLDGKGGMVMIAATDRGLKIADDDRLNYLNKEYGDIACKSFEFSFNSDVIDHPTYGPLVKAAISKALSEVDIPQDQKATLFVAKPILKYKKGLPEMIRAVAAKSMDKAKRMFADVGLICQVKGAKYNGLLVPTIEEAIDAFEKVNKKSK